MTPAVQAGIPVKESDYEKTEIEGVTIYYRKDMADFVFEIQWVGFWIFGQFLVKEIDVA